MEKFIDRHHAGKVLATYLKSYKNNKTAIVLALPRGGVPVAYEIAKALSISLDVFIVRKLGVPGHEELAMGAIATGNITVFNQNILQELMIDQSAIDEVIQQEKEELSRRDKKYRHDRSFPALTGKIIILVDDGIATGATMRAAVKALRQFSPAKIIMAVPVAAASTCEEMQGLVDELICPLTPPYFNAVGIWYEDFEQTTDEEVQKLLLDAGVG